MPIRVKIVALTISVGIIVLIVELVRRRKLLEEYSRLWFLTGAVILVLMVWFDLLKIISHVIGAISHVSTIFFFALLFLVLISLHFSVVISKLTNQIKTLAQDYAILKGECERLKKQISPQGDDKGDGSA